MISLNATLKLTFRNTGTFFGVHVKPTPIDLSYSELAVASGNVSLFSQFSPPEFYNYRYSISIFCFVFSDEKVLSIEKEPEISEYSGIGEQNSVVRQWSRSEQLNGDDEFTGAIEIELCGSI